MKNLKINIGIKNKSTLQKEIENLFKNQSFNIDVTSFSKSISSMSKELNKLKSQLKDFNILDSSSIEKSKGSITDLTNETNKLANQMAKVRENSEIRVKNTSRKEELAQSQAINKALEEEYRLEQQLSTLKTQLNAKLTTASNNGLIDSTVITKLKNELNSITVDTPIAKVNELKAAINNLGSSDSGIIRLQQAVTKLQERISTIKANNIDVINQGEIAELKAAENEVLNLRNMLTQLKAGDVIDGKKISSSINQATNSVKTLENEFRNVNTTASGLATTMKTIFSYAIGGSGIYLAMNSMREAFSTVVELDDSLRDLRRVTELTNAEYEKFMYTANQTAIALGTTTTGAIDATTRFSQLGYSFDEASNSLSKYGLVLSNVADMSAKDASSAIVSTLKGFQLETEDVSKIVDVINEAG